MMDPRYAAADPAKFWERVIPSEGCWLWSGVVNPTTGYSQFSVRTDTGVITIYAHRWAYELLVGPVPDGLELDHLCRNRECVRPDHLEPVLPAVNVRRGVGPERTRLRYAAQTHCRNGHPLAGDNLRLSRRGAYTARVCRTCQADAMKRFYERRRVGAAA